MGTLGKLFQLMNARTSEDREDAMRALKGETIYKRYHELLEVGELNASYLIREQVAKDIKEGADLVRCMRDALKATTFEMKTSPFRYVLRQLNHDVLPVVPDGADYPTASSSVYSEVLFNARKRGLIAPIGEELIENSMWDLVERSLRDLGRMAENTINRKAIDVLLANAGHDVSYNSTEPVLSIANAIKTLKESGFVPDTLVMTAEMEASLFMDPHFRYDYSGEVGAIRKRELRTPILGIRNIYVLTVPDTNGSWGGSIKGVIYDSLSAAGLGIKEDVTLSQFEDPRNDIKNIKVRMSFDVQPFWTESIVTISS